MTLPRMPVGAAGFSGSLREGGQAPEQTGSREGLERAGSREAAKPRSERARGKGWSVGSCEAAQPRSERARNELTDAAHPRSGLRFRYFVKKRLFFG
ncbi:hypothetical protein DQG13_28385 [Paenibacillus sp. YN15]|nr:hypothetical protein DQG13_28385 [Paenibacillus sp. YN15]